MEEQLAELKQQRQEAVAFAALWGLSLARLPDETGMYLGASQMWLGAEYDRLLTLAHWRTLGTLARCGSLPHLRSLYIMDNDTGDEGVPLLADGLRRGRLPSLRDLRLVFAKIGHRALDRCY